MVVVTKTGEFPLEVQDFFPFIPRPGQTLMANEIYYGLLAHSDVAIEGAAGMGKTITSLSAILPICLREGYRLLYVARTHTQIQRVIEELSAIYRRKGFDITGIALHGRANMCLQPEVCEAPPSEAMELCAELRRRRQCQWYENLKKKEIDNVQGCFTADYIRDFGTSAEICPYFLSKQLMKHCNVIALTYIYLIEPFMRKILFKTLDSTIENCILVFDECHNLPELAMHAMSLGISDRGVKRALKEYTYYDSIGKFPIVYQFLQYVQRYLNCIRKEYGTPEEDLEVPVNSTMILEYFKEFATQYNVQDIYALQHQIDTLGKLVRRLKLENKQKTQSSIAHFAQFIERLIQTIGKPQYLHYLIVSKDRVQFYIRCIDCRDIIAPLKNARGIVSMSGTLEPISAYLEICGFPTTTRCKVLPSPFSHERVRVFTIRGIDVSYYSRTAPQYQTLANKCLEMVCATPGNSAFFCASYEVLEGFLHKTDFQDEVRRLQRPFFHEAKELTSSQNDEIIAQFKAAGHQRKNAVLLGVCGGRNSEGVDFPGPEMISVAVLGIPLARWTHSINALIKYYTNQFGAWQGKEYAYVLPAFRRTNQAAGRPIRTHRDYGVVGLLDERYTHAYYRRFLSHWINENMVILPDRPGILGEEIEKFFQNQKRGS